MFNSRRPCAVNVSELFTLLDAERASEVALLFGIPVFGIPVFGIPLA
ncbi:hypothetical protein [Streptomyces sp. NPDC020951]